MDSGYGKCAVCHRTVALATPTAHVYRGKPLRAYLVHKGCKDEQEAPSKPVVVSDPAVFAAASYGFTEVSGLKEARQEPQPSMPTKEQTGTRRRRKKADAQEDDPGADSGVD